tara:strand:+ start:225 stop:527 length:303 start_codon:yes stop_codon:yes gene_type:complete
MSDIKRETIKIALEHAANKLSKCQVELLTLEQLIERFGINQAINPATSHLLRAGAVTKNSVRQHNEKMQELLKADIKRYQAILDEIGAAWNDALKKEAAK